MIILTTGFKAGHFYTKTLRLQFLRSICGFIKLTDHSLI